MSVYVQFPTFRFPELTVNGGTCRGVNWLPPPDIYVHPIDIIYFLNLIDLFTRFSSKMLSSPLAENFQTELKRITLNEMLLLLNYLARKEICLVVYRHLKLTSYGIALPRVRETGFYNVAHFHTHFSSLHAK